MSTIFSIYPVTQACCVLSILKSIIEGVGSSACLVSMKPSSNCNTLQGRVEGELKTIIINF
jgi:hypothetical protein